MKTRGCYIWAMPPIIVLFDIDGTLLRAGGAGRRSVELAIGEVLNDLDGKVRIRNNSVKGACIVLEFESK